MFTKGFEFIINSDMRLRFGASGARRIQGQINACVRTRLWVLKMLVWPNGLSHERVWEENDINCERGHHTGSDCGHLSPSVLLRAAKEPHKADGPLKSKMDSSHTQPAGCCLGHPECV